MLSPKSRASSHAQYFEIKVYKEIQKLGLAPVDEIELIKFEEVLDKFILSEHNE